MDWDELEFDIELNSSYNNVEDDVVVKYGKPEIIVDYITDYSIIHKCKNSDEVARSIFIANRFPLEKNFTNSIQYHASLFDKTNKIKIKNINDIYFINGYTVIPLLNNKYERQTIEYYYLCNLLDITKYKNVLIYHESHPNFFDVLKLYFPKIERFSIKADFLTLKNNEYDIIFSAPYDIFGVKTCDWFYQKINHYILLLIHIAKYSKNNSICIIAFDFRNFNIDIFNQIIILYSCFMKIRIISNKLVAFDKCYILGTDINIDKLNNFYKKNKTIFYVSHYAMSFERINNKCINTGVVIIDINLKLDFDDKFKKQIEKIKTIYFNIKNKRDTIIFDTNISPKTIIKKTYNTIYKYIVEKQIPIVLNNYYLDKPDKIILKLTDINKIYFPDILNVKFKKLRLTPSALYSVTYPKEAEKITNIIYDIVGNVKIIDACANVGGNTISFAQKFKKVISIELDNINYKALKKNIKQYGFTNIKTKNMDCLEYIKNHNYDVIFFDPPWGGNLIYSQESVIIKLSGIDINKIIEDLIKENKKVFMKVPLNFHSNLNKKVFKIKNYQLIYFYN
jgi:16S rRNA G966 N2-methylase RsmD